jgi:hypothetical protein
MLLNLELSKMLSFLWGCDICYHSGVASICEPEDPLRKNFKLNYSLILSQAIFWAAVPPSPLSQEDCNLGLK